MKHTLEPQKICYDGRILCPFTLKILGSIGHIEADVLRVFWDLVFYGLEGALRPKMVELEAKRESKRAMNFRNNTERGPSFFAAPANEFACF